MDFSFVHTPYKKDFKKPIDLMGKPWKAREGILVTITLQEGKSILAEMAPLPEWGTETIAQALCALECFKGKLSTDQLHAIAKDYPAIASGFYLALFQPCVENEIPPNRISFLLDLEDPMESFKAGKKEGHCVFKLKIGRKNLAHEIDLYKRLRDKLPEAGLLRLDPNGRFTALDFIRWCDTVDPQCVEFIEQPFLNTIELLAIEPDSPVPIALDESVATWNNLEDWIQKQWPGLFVIKPSLLGKIPSFIEWQKANSNRIVYSSAFETHVGLAHVMKFAQAHPSPRAMGLGTAHYLN